jgi:GNAT superfamily N-acetyltransferase
VNKELVDARDKQRTSAIIPGPEPPDTSPVRRLCSSQQRYLVGVGASSYSIRPLEESTWPGFAALVERNNGIFGGCWCMAFHPEGAGQDTTAELNQDRKLARVRAGTAHAALVFDGGDCLGWCQFGPPGELPRIKSRAAYSKDQTAPPDWRIACCYVGKGHRRQGVAAAALAGALDLIAGLGGGTVEGYPESADSVPSGFLYNGALSTYEKLGFTRNRKIGKHRWVVTRLVEPRPA